MNDKPLGVIFPELNSFQIAKLRFLLKDEYERGRKAGLLEYKAKVEQ